MTKTPQPAFDVSLYTRAPIISIETGLPLIAKLLTCLRSDDPPAVRNAATQMRATAVTAQHAWVDRMRQLAAVEPSNRRVIDNTADVAWRALFDRLSAFASLPIAIAPRASRAAEIVHTLFLGGLGFLNDDYDVQYAHMDSRLLLVGSENLAADIDALAGPEFLAAVRAAHGPYGEMAMRAKGGDASGVADVNLREHVDALADEIVAYGIQVIATIKKAHPTTLDVARRLLKPLDDHRVAHARAKSSGQNAPPPATPETPQAPLPDVPGAPAGAKA